MRAYFMDELPGDQRLLHDSGRPATDEILSNIGVLHWHVPLDAAGEWENEINAIAAERDYKNRDIVVVNKEAMGAEFETKTKAFYHEHMHEDEEIRYILEGGGYFDVREHSSDSWIRCHLGPGDLLVLPAGIYHRFSLDMGNKSRTMRLFKDEPKWLAYNRGATTDASPYRLDYLKTLDSVATAA
ncbi:1,2-dihydroxy-3-keto-5-methylthiopentene dioxygenase 1 [Sparassis crispa]|uniref:Acireductone dioxygenase n=1 Tax=Sparassis crispa TaxID=139825 RepID=A0A401G571_9APHY|nr:1,2-dihydroxy-3-keto-5-methylthiopentene dioxygenase 1 [Sparassis crispa]GBE77316.1 1,2-dihydroxy-3-keto-5-methylthiopentene dioxygenase 1 [Sparassis crispa]